MSRSAARWPRAAPAVGFIAIGCALLSGCGTADAERDAGRAAERLHAAAAGGDGEAACEELTEEATDELEKQTRARCEEAVLDLGLAESNAGRVRVYLRSASVDLLQGGTVFLDETSEGWKVSAAGCAPRPGLPYECELEG